MDDWDVLCLQVPGMMMPPEHIHKQFKCDRKAGWGASIIVHERFVNRVTFNTTGTIWVVIGLDFSDLGWRDVGEVSAHLPPRKTKKELDDSEYYGTIVEYADAVRRLKKQMPTARFIECIDANVELPHLDDMTHTLTGELCIRHGINSRAIDLLEHLRENKLRAINTWPCEAHATRDNAWTCLGARGEQRLIDYICYEEALPYRVCYKEDVNTDHRAIHTAIQLAQEADLIQHVTFIKEKKRRRTKSKKHWAPSTEAAATTFRGNVELLSGRSATLKTFQEGMVSLIQGTPSRTKGNSRPIRPQKTAEQTAAERMVEEAQTPLGSVYAARRVMKLKRAANNQFQKIVRDWEALYGQRKDKLTQKVQTPRHHDHIFSTSAPEAAGECIRGYYEDLFNSRRWKKEDYQLWFHTSVRHLTDSSRNWRRLHIPISTLIDSWRGIKHGKAPGRDGIANEALAYFNWESLCRLRGFSKKNNNEEGGEVSDLWFDIDIQCIPKNKKPETWGNGAPFRYSPLCRNSCCAVTARMYDDWIDLPLWMAGFMEGRQTLELTFAVQQAFGKSLAMGRGCWVAKLDVRKAFDTMDHPEFASLCESYGIHPSLILSTLREWEGARTTIEVNGFGSRINMMAGGRQGGRDTPKLWNILLYLILRDLVEEWEKTTCVGTPDA